MSRIIAVCAVLISSLALPMLYPSSMVQSPRVEKAEEMVTLFGGSGRDLLERCSAPTVKVGDTVPVTELIKGASHNGQCLGYIIGVSDEALTYLAYASNAKRNYCLPSEVRSEQLVMVVKKYLEDNPAQLHLPAGPLTIHALTDAFPCR